MDSKSVPMGCSALFNWNQYHQPIPVNALVSQVLGPYTSTNLDLLYSVDRQPSEVRKCPTDRLSRIPGKVVSPAQVIFQQKQDSG